jgi:hypothetical protein
MSFPIDSAILVTMRTNHAHGECMTAPTICTHRNTPRERRRGVGKWCVRKQDKMESKQIQDKGRQKVGR